MSAATRVAPAKRTHKPLPAGFRRELDKQQTAIYEAQAVAICIMKAMEEHFSGWPNTMPLFNFALRRVVAQLESVAKGLHDEELTAAVMLADSWDGEEG